MEDSVRALARVSDASGNVAEQEFFITRTHDHSTAPTRILSGSVSLSETTIPSGEWWAFDPDVTTTVEVDGNLIVEGKLEMHPNSPSVEHTLRFVNVDEVAMVGGGMDPVPTDKGLWITHGHLHACGQTKTAWARVTSSVPVGARQIILDSPPSNWNPGDELVIAPSGSPITDSSAHTRFDQLKVESVSGNVVTLASPTLYEHPVNSLRPGVSIGTEVYNISRNVKIQGTPTGRTHIMITHSGTADVCHTEISHTGPRKDPETFVLGRYGLHFHMTGDASRGSVVEGVVIRDSGSHAFVAHGSHGITFNECVSHNTFEDPYWWDPRVDTRSTGDASNDITYNRCIASLVKVVPSFRGYRLAGFVLEEGLNNKIIDCVAVGVQGNKDASGVIWPESTGRIWENRGIVAHNNKRHGIFTWQNSQDEHHIDQAVCYNNGHSGISHGAYVNGYKYDDCVLVGNKVSGFLMHAKSNSLILTLSNFYISGSPSAIWVAKHTLDSDYYVVVSNLVARGYTIAAVNLGYDQSNGVSPPTLIEVRDPDWLASVPEVVFHANTTLGSTVRIVEGGQITRQYVK